MKSRDFFSRLLRRPRYPAVVFSVLLHIAVVFFAGYYSRKKSARKKVRKEKRVLAAVQLQAIPLAPLSAPSSVQVFREDLFNDTKDEEKNLFKLRRTEDKRRTIKINQDDAFRNLTVPGKGSGGGSTNTGYLPEYALDKPPIPLKNLPDTHPLTDQAAALGISVFSVVVELMIDATGVIVKIRLVTNGDFGFGKAALKALAGLKYRPGLVRGKAVPSLIRERILFK